jgi:hypothetical protein
MWLFVLCGLAFAACGGNDKAGEADKPGGPPDATEVVGADTVGTTEVVSADGDARTEDVLGPDACVPACVDEEGNVNECGPDGCGGSCGECPPGSICGEADYAAVGVCFDAAAECPGICASEGAQCGTAWTGLSEPEDCDCGPCPEGMECMGQICCEVDGQGLCKPYCPEGKCPDPCSTDLAMWIPCSDPDDCQNGMCVSPPYSSESMCTCTCLEECPPPYECLLATTADDPDVFWGCFPPCPPDCEGMECGDDGCGGTCGVCEEGFACFGGLCQEEGA